MLYRTSDAFKTLSAEVGGEEIGCGGMYGFLNVAVKLFRRYCKGKVYVAWEGKRSKNFRRELYPDYKNKGEPDPEKLEFLQDMGEQEKRLKAMLRAMGVRQFKGANCEADDVIAWLAWEAQAAGKNTIVYTGDSDLRQLVHGDAKAPRIAVISPGFKAKDVVYDTAESVKAKHGVAPELLADLKALAGDNSDNIPGVRGCGPKTAATLLNTYGSLDGVLAKAKNGAEDWPVADRFKGMISEMEGDIRLYRRLTGLLDAPEVIEIPRRRSQKTLVRHFQAYKFRSLIVPSELMDLMRMGE